MSTPNTPFTPCVFVRGAGAGKQVWKPMLEALHAAGWRTIQDREQAWFLGRGGVPLGFVDFTEEGQVQVALLKSRYQELRPGVKRMILPAITGSWFDAEREQQPQIAVDELRQLFTALAEHQLPAAVTQVADDVDGRVETGQDR